MHYTVCTPQYWTYDYQQIDPPEYGADCVDVEAANRRQAKVEAVRKMRKERMAWIEDQASDKRSPFRGLIVWPCVCDHGFCHCSLQDCIQPNPEYLLLDSCPECDKMWEQEYDNQDSILA